MCISTLQVRTTPNAETANRPAFKEAIGGLLRLNVQGVGSVDGGSVGKVWDGAAADVERLLVAGGALAELAPWQGRELSTLFERGLASCVPLPVNLYPGSKCLQSVELSGLTNQCHACP